MHSMVNWITNTFFFIFYFFLGVVDIQIKYRNCVLCIPLVKLEMEYTDVGGSVKFTISTPGLINDVVSRIVFHLQTWNL